MTARYRAYTRRIVDIIVGIISIERLDSILITSDRKKISRGIPAKLPFKSFMIFRRSVKGVGWLNRPFFRQLVEDNMAGDDNLLCLDVIEGVVSGLIITNETSFVYVWM